MDPQQYTPYDANNIPLESKLATYMGRQKNTSTPTFGGLKTTMETTNSVKVNQGAVPRSPDFFTSRIDSTQNYFTSIRTNNSIEVVDNVTSILGINNTYKSNLRLIEPHSPATITPQSSPPVNNIVSNIHQQTVGGTTYFFTAPVQSNINGKFNTETKLLTSTEAHASCVKNNIESQPNLEFNYYGKGNVYPGPTSNVANMQSGSQSYSAFFMPDELRNAFKLRNEIANQRNMNENTDIPQEVGNYHSLFPLENQLNISKMTLQSSTYKATHALTGVKYCLRRLHGFRLKSTKYASVFDAWKKLQHSNIVQLREVFTTKSFDDTSLILVYDYYPGAQTLLTKYFTKTIENDYSHMFGGVGNESNRIFSPTKTNATMYTELVSEPEIWSIITQLTAGLRSIHQAGLACRTIDLTKIIIVDKRIRFSFVGITDIIYFDPTQTNTANAIANYQQEDLTALGKLIVALACRNLLATKEEHIQNSISVITRRYSPDLRNLICYLLSITPRVITDLMPMIGARFYTQIDALQSQCDMQEDEIIKLMDTDRLYRILVKLGCINERPDFNLDVSWSETGDRYMLKLFRDYLFHSVTEDGKPWLDHAHIIQCLNKLDAGTTEKIQLMSRDEQSVLIVTFSELKHCLEQSFSELVSSCK